MTIIADLLCPERCAACGALVHPRALLCRGCAAVVRRLGPPECRRCGMPERADEPCTTCVADSPIRAARAWAAYRGDDPTSPVARAIFAFKYDGAVRLGRRLAHLMLPRVPIRPVGLVVPAPLHARRLRRRGFNQSAVLARHIARDLGCGLALTAVERVRDTPSQVGLRSSERERNVASAFRVRRPEVVRGRSVLVVDDVWTSGATARAIAGALRAAGANAVDVLTLARVL